jgi:hypothetical protein
VNLALALVIVLILLAIDWILGIFTAMLAGTFVWAVWFNQVRTMGLPIIGTYVALLVGQSFTADGTFNHEGLVAAAYTLAGTATVKLVGDIVLKAASLGGGQAKA